MNSKWDVMTLGELVTIKGGKRLPKGENLQDTKNEHPYIRVRDMHDGRIDTSNLLYVPDRVFRKISRYIINSGDVFISIVGTIGLVGIIGDDLDNASLTENAAKLTDFSDNLLPKFLYYHLKSSLGQNQITALTVGTTQPKLALKRVAMIEIPLPPLPTQERIADILGTLDDKIELNRQMNRTLEAMARAIFKSWFVDFDPVYSKMEGRDSPLPAEVMALFPDELVESELGLIPKGWEVGKLQKYAEFIKGVSYRRADLNGDEFSMVNLKSFQRGGGYRSDGLKPFSGKFNPEQEVFPGEVIVAHTDVTQAADVLGKAARIGFPGENKRLILSLDVTVVRGKEIRFSNNYLYLLLSRNEFSNHCFGYANGTTVLHLNRKALPEYQFVKPTNDILAVFSDYISPFFKKIDNTEQQIQTIDKLHSLLLPKLMTGEIEV